MNQIQQSNITVANFIIGELAKDKPFTLVLDAGQTGALHNIAIKSHHPHSGFVGELVKVTKAQAYNGTGIQLKIDESNADPMYHILSSYVAQNENPKNNIDQFIASGEFDKAFRDVFGLPESVVQSLKEVS